MAQQQVLTQRQQWDAAAAVAQQAAAEKLQLEQQALERDLQQLRQDQARYDLQQWYAFLLQHGLYHLVLSLLTVLDHSRTQHQ